MEASLAGNGVSTRVFSKIQHWGQPFRYLFADRTSATRGSNQVFGFGSRTANPRSGNNRRGRFCGTALARAQIDRDLAQSAQD
jgi:hypothetical protein